MESDIAIEQELRAPINPVSAALLVKQYGADFALDVAYRIFEDQKTGRVTGDYNEATREYLEEQCGDMAFTILVELKLESLRLDLGIYNAINKESEPPVICKELPTYDPEKYRLVRK